VCVCVCVLRSRACCERGVEESCVLLMRCWGILCAVNAVLRNFVCCECGVEEFCVL